MELTEGEFSSFSLKGRVMLAEEFGTFLSQIETNDTLIKVYGLFGFYVEVIYDKWKNEIMGIKPISFNLLRFYLED